VGGSGVDIEDIAFGKRPYCSGSMMYVDVRKFGEIAGSTLRDRWLDLEGVYDSCLSYQLREQGCVVAGAGADVNDPFALPGSRAAMQNACSVGCPLLRGPWLPSETTTS
jgi:hypothetical protein